MAKNTLIKEKKVHGLAIKMRIVADMTAAGFTDPSDYIDYLVAAALRATKELELLKNDKGVKEVLQALPTEASS